MEAALSNRSLPTDCQRDEKIFRTVLLKPTSHHIPTGRHRLHEEPVPAELLDVMNRRDDLSKIDPTSPELPRLNKDIQNRVCVHKRKKWRYFVETMDQKTDLTKLWRTIKGIDGTVKREAENEAITFNEISFSSSKQQATKFNQQFNTSKLGRHTSSRETRVVTMETKKYHWRWHERRPKNMKQKSIPVRLKLLLKWYEIYIKMLIMIALTNDKYNLSAKLNIFIDIFVYNSIQKGSISADCHEGWF